MIYILEEFKKRTEYKILSNFISTTELSLGELGQGCLVLPGYVLNKMSKQDILRIESWLENRNNQLILLPSWIEIKLDKIFQLSVGVSITKVEQREYKGLPVEYKIEGHSKDVIYLMDGDVLGINIRKNTGMGVITIVTLPLLDYRLTEKVDIMQELFLKLLIPTASKPIDEKPKEKEPFQLNNVHTHLIILKAAGIQLENCIEEVNKYFNYDVLKDELTKYTDELVQNHYIENDKLTQRAFDCIENKKLKSFIRVIKERRDKENEWE
ncbi:hypothetical protein SAMN02745120_0085 [Acetoanaerobium noterae]|uniref:Uncharacterized protein n=1 Tax=Acetoanaerobium noterae TaxID=745369 RepID=A0A1T5DMY0_9FIRM|nr:hypothetical protein [Acetoanaerobium noterae]SKB73039.1 hypothetical protein SAMN02745120_0085 [Acetoanaerobium noterae]